MDKELKKEKLDINSLEIVSGGVTIDVSSESICCKPKGSFKILEDKENIWKNEGCPLKCKYCWHLKYKDGFYCDI